MAEIGHEPCSEYKRPQDSFNETGTTPQSLERRNAELWEEEARGML
jgi:hypothetical protein